MQELDDISLLGEYVDHESEDAFAALVARHVNKVYSIAWRHARNPHQAEEIPQAVFVVLASKARRLGDNNVAPLDVSPNSPPTLTLDYGQGG